jgi:hypothetical protein
MPLTADQRHVLLLADRPRDVGQITVVIEHVFAVNSDANLIAGGAGLSIVFGFPAWRAALVAGGMTPAANRAMLTAR